MRAHTHIHHVVDQGQSHGKHQCLSAKNSLREKEEEMISSFGEGTEKRGITLAKGIEFQGKKVNRISGNAAKSPGKLGMGNSVSWIF